MSVDIDIDRCIEKLKKGREILEQKEVKLLCDKAIEILIQESTVIQLKTPITVRFFYSHSPLLPPPLRARE